MYTFTEINQLNKVSWEDEHCNIIIVNTSHTTTSSSLQYYTFEGAYLCAHNNTLNSRSLP